MQEHSIFLCIKIFFRLNLINIIYIQINSVTVCNVNVIVCIDDPSCTCHMAVSFEKKMKTF